MSEHPDAWRPRRLDDSRQHRAASPDAPTPEAECPCEGTGYIEVGTYQRARVICEEHFVPGDPNATGPAPIPATEGRREGETRALLVDLRDRIAEKRTVLRSLRDDAGDESEQQRLEGKAEGMGVAASYVDEAIRSLPAPSAGTVQPGAQRPTADLATKTIVLHYASDGAAFTLGDWTLIAPPGTTPEQADALLAAALGSSEGEDE